MSELTALEAEYRRYQASGGVADLSARTKLQFTGADRVRYLNGQVTANVSKLKPGEVLPACVTTAKGKLSAEVLIHAAASAEAPALLVDAEPELREELAARLERYIIADDVALEDVTDAWALFHVLGQEPSALAPLAAYPAQRARRFGPVSWDVWVPAAESATLRGALPPMLSEALLETLRIEAGVPRWGHELGENTLPPEAGLDRTHVDYHKGCYIGQEVISRLKSVGHVNRQLTGFTVAGAEYAVLPGATLYRAEAPDLPVGQITSAAWSFALAKPVALGYLKRGLPGGSLLARPAESPASAIEISPASLPFRAP